MNADQVAAVITIAFLILLNGFFTLAKTCLVTVRQARLTHMIADGARPETADAIQRLMREPGRVFATVQVGITLATFSAAALSAVVLAPELARFLARWHVPHDLRVATVLLTLIVAFFAITIGDLVPYSYALRYPERAAMFVARPLTGFVIAFSVLANIALAVSNVMVKPFGLTASFASPMITEEELRTLLDAGAQSGAIEEDEKEIIRNVISFGDTDVRQVMTPRIDMTAADVNIGLQALVDLIVQSGHSRIPVYDDSVDAIVGIVHAKDLLAPLSRGETSITLASVVRAPLFVPENKRVDDLLEEFRRASLPIAIVQDEYGGTAGLVTIEDLLEELVGEISDEYDTDVPMFRRIDADAALLDGRMSITDLNEEMDVDIPTDDFDTIGGFVFGLIGHQPPVGVCVTYEGIEFKVTRTDGRRIQEVRLERHRPGDDRDDETTRAPTGSAQSA